MKAIIFFLVAVTLLFANSIAVAQSKDSDLITRDTIISAEGIVLTSKDRLSTPGSFQPPVEII